MIIIIFNQSAKHAAQLTQFIINITQNFSRIIIVSIKNELAYCVRSVLLFLFGTIYLID